jgi:hypothetical protein
LAGYSLLNMTPPIARQSLLRRMQRLGWLADPVLRKLLSSHNSVAEEWYCDAFAYWAAGTLPEPHAVFFDELLAEVRVFPVA